MREADDPEGFEASRRQVEMLIDHIAPDPPLEPTVDPGVAPHGVQDNDIGLDSDQPVIVLDLPKRIPKKTNALLRYEADCAAAQIISSKQKATYERNKVSHQARAKSPKISPGPDIDHFKENPNAPDLSNKMVNLVLDAVDVFLPKTIKKACASINFACWEAAAEDKMAGLLEMGVYHWVSPPLITVLWALTGFLHTSETSMVISSSTKHGSSFLVTIM